MLGPGFERRETFHFEDYPRLQMKDFPGRAQHCSITGLTSVFMYYSNQGYDYLPKNEQTMFQRIMRLARWRGINLGQIGFFKGGTIPFFIGHLARVTWRFYGYLDGKAELHSFLQSGRRGEPEILMELDEGRPLLLSLSSGYYKRHTVTVWGYEVWERQKQNIPENNSNDAGESSTENRARVGDFVINATGIERRVMLVINDHWSPEKRYIDL